MLSVYTLYSFFFFFFFFFNVPATTNIYTLSLHDALPIWRRPRPSGPSPVRWGAPFRSLAPNCEKALPSEPAKVPKGVADARSEERRVGKECRCWWWPEH